MIHPSCALAYVRTYACVCMRYVRAIIQLRSFVKICIIPTGERDTRGVYASPLRASRPSLNAPLLFSLCLLCKIIIRAIRRVHAYTRASLNGYCCAAERSRLSIDRDMRFHLAIMMDRGPVYAQSFITTSPRSFSFPVVLYISFSFHRRDTVSPLFISWTLN